MSRDKKYSFYLDMTRHDVTLTSCEFNFKIWTQTQRDIVLKILDI